MHHPLIEVRADGSVRVRTTRVSRVGGVAVDGGRVAFVDLDDVLTFGRLTEHTVEPKPGAARLVRPDGRALARRRNMVCRGPCIHVRERGRTDWSVFDMASGDR
ncbi:hypothetical protein ACFU9B_28000 [Streptomyces sp. NPDC057592]|uniref:hypothetical protein n=1 Tax=unclassified Streptomyces TaxID=2593676 RepID=UPI003680D58B